MADDLGRQTTIQASINDLFKERTKLLEEQEKILSRQAEIANKLREALGSGSNLNSQVDSVQQLNGALDQNAKHLDKSKKASESLWATFALKAKNAFSKMKEFFSVPNLFTNIAAAVKDVVGSMIDLATAILAIPFKLFDAFVDMANKFEFNPAIFLALQEIKEAFGDLSRGPAKAVADNLRTIRHESMNLANTGLSVYRVFGYGPEGIAEALKAVNDLAIHLGASFYNLQDVIKRNGIQMVMMAKGLGLSNEQMAAQMRFAQAMGKDPVKAQFEFANAALQTGKAFGMSSKIIARGMNELIQQFPQLGKQGPKALAPIVAYAQKLGIEVKDLTGAFEKFSSFESAADSASQLSQAFGVNIDAMRIMSEENPAKKMEMLRLAFQSAGKDATHMGVAERKLAEQLTGVSGAAFDAAFGLGNKKVKMTEVEKQTQQAMKTQMSQIQVMKELGKAIKLIAPPAPKEFQGPLDALLQGFELGIRRAHDARKAMMNFRMSMQTLYFLGRDLGIMFVKYFPGVKEVFQALAKFFEPGKFRAFSAEARTAFAAFFKDPVKGFETFIETMKNMINKHFGSGADGALSLMTEGIDKFTKMAGGILGKSITLISGLIVDGLKGLTDIIAGRKKAVVPGAAEAKGFAANIFGPLKDALFEALPKIGDALGDVFSAIWKRIKKWWENEGKAKAMELWDKYGYIFKTIMILKFGPSILSAIGGISNMLGGGFNLLSKSPVVMGAIKNAALSLSGSFAKFMDPSNSTFLLSLGKFFPNLSLNIMSVFSKALPFLKGLVSKIPIIGTIISALVGIFDAYKFGDSPEDKALMDAGMGKFDAFTSGMLKAMTFGLVDLRGDLEAETKRVKELAKKAAADQAEGFKEAADESQKAAESAAVQALKEGNKEDALSYMAKAELQKAIASGQFDMSKMTSEQYQAAQKKFREDAKERLRPELDKKFKEVQDSVIKEAANKKEMERAAQIEKSKTLVEQVKDIAELQKEVDSGLEKINSALKSDVFEKKLDEFATKIAKIYPKIEDAAKKIASARTQSFNIIDEGNPVESLVKIFKSVVSLGDIVSNASKSLSDTNVELIKLAVKKLFGEAGTSDPNSIFGLLSSYQDVSIDTSPFTTLRESFESIEKAVDSAVKAQKAIGNMVFFPVSNFVTSSITFLTRPLMKDAEKIGSFSALKDAMESISDAAKLASAAEKSLSGRTIENISSFISGISKSTANMNISDIVKIMTVANAVARVTEAAITAGTTFKSAAQVATAVKKFSGGEIKVSHSIPNVKMDVVINLDTKEFARKMIEVNVAKDGTKAKRIDFSTHSDKVNYGD